MEVKPPPMPPPMATARVEPVDVLSIYPGKHGGIRATQEIAKMA
jgi:hypothetical protein